MDQRELSRRRLIELTDEIESREFGRDTLEFAAQLAASEGHNLDQLPIARRIDLLEGIARARIERERAFSLRLTDRFAPFEPSHPLFANAVNCTVWPLATPQFAQGPTVGEAIEAYLEYGRAIPWAPKTVLHRVRRLSDLREHLGAETPLASVTSHDIRRFRDALLALRSRNRGQVGGSFLVRQTENRKHRIAPKTASLAFEPCKAFFRWAKEKQGYIERDPAGDVQVALPRKSRASRSRRPFTAAELELLFKAPLYSGCKSAGRRFEPGTVVQKDDRFWIPVLGYYTGARLGEIVQLYMQDVNLDADIPFVEITDETSDGSAAEGKRLKSDAAHRRVPLHPDLIALGFPEFVHRRRSVKRRSKRLFAEIKYGQDGQASTVFSKWFARFMDKAGLTDRTITFHSFRHNAEDAFKNATQQQYVIDRIIGHSDGAVSSQYGQGISLETAFEAVKAMKLLVRLPTVWANPQMTSGSSDHAPE
jgi:integrase